MKGYQKILTLVLVGLVSLAGCAKLDLGTMETAAEPTDQESIKLGIMGDDTSLWEPVQERLKAQGISLDLFKFTSYDQANKDLLNGQIDVNASQTKAYLENFNTKRKAKLAPIGNTMFSPLGLYSHKVDHLDDLRIKARLVIPKDPTNAGRALKLLEEAGLITLKENLEGEPTLKDIQDNPKQFKIDQVEADKTPPELTKADAVVINTNFALEAKMDPVQDALVREDLAEEEAAAYVQVLAVRAEEADDPRYQKLVDAFQASDVAARIKEISKGASQAAWETFGRQ
ncbi:MULTISPECIES: MetQ/NlpA family ABC transporter substrate-binding protein [Aerococcus]|uniref:MetQ/NlpA family ABC transporter substrate-binding protein n=1 Tax=Aerococcus sanguinicola TaxID=119206 RepID=A0A5N1GQ40_9LACT|nr:MULTISPECIES: MetQ/NlpA family ABC transporter substrate-binding protein [Aerococcus]KAA9302369.1 MetQ/NlpA family ABC transporter substrate-binding protein [Aerococcus sanguinicola]MDK6369741.1 MetQ/NlpA family ABC transporter substrate-binding protein [Aerococcus sp. UMB9870]MDK6680381.1 MetQ/NlpA family ABC transporter substrate-binding protein [Aerococcus sp. UMB8608]MDK6687122.1 MetQ/NlpA family ABC transporter substrate-binding protein [Aerococcus sp. UMB8623]MDK6940341.1 MetQ/NlpA fa